jgi:hypothetical protein
LIQNKIGGAFFLINRDFLPLSSDRFGSGLLWRCRINWLGSGGDNLRGRLFSRWLLDWRRFDGSCFSRRLGGRWLIYRCLFDRCLFNRRLFGGCRLRGGLLNGRLGYRLLGGWLNRG